MDLLDFPRIFCFSDNYMSIFSSITGILWRSFLFMSLLGQAFPKGTDLKQAKQLMSPLAPATTAVVTDRYDGRRKKIVAPSLGLRNPFEAAFFLAGGCLSFRSLGPFVS